MDSPAEVTGPVNLGNPTEFTMRELAEIVIAETGSSSPLVPRHFAPKEHFDWIPTVPLREGIKPTISYFRS